MYNKKMFHVKQTKMIGEITGMKQTDSGEKSKKDLRRLEKKNRLKAQTDKKGKKKAIKTGSRLGRVLFPIILVVLVLVLFLWAAFAAGLPQRLIPPMKIGNQAVKGSEYNYFYNMQVNQIARMGLIRPNQTGQYDLTAKSLMDPEKTWEEYFHEATEQSIQDIYLKADQAAKNNIALDEKEKKQIQDYFDQLKAQYKTDAEYANALLQQFGPGAKPDRLAAMFERVTLAHKFEQEHLKTYDVTAEDIKKYYDENKDNLDYVTYHSFMIAPEDPTKAEAKGEDNKEAKPEVTAAEKEKLKQEAKAKAEEMLDRLTDENTFDEVAKSYATDTDKEAETLQTNLKGSIVNKEVADWLFDQERENGDKAVIESNDRYFVVYYVSREQDNAHLPGVRHILFEADREKATAEQKESAKQAAEETLAKIKSEEQMKELGDQLVQDGKAKESERYDEVPLGQMVTEFNDWIFDENRKTGDTGIVETQYGYHVMYFTGRADKPVWESKSEQAIRKNKFEEEIKALKEQDEYKIHISDLGMKLAKKR